MPCRIITIAEHGDHFLVELILTDPAQDYRTIRATLPAPIRPDNRIGRLLSAAGTSVVAGEHIDSSQKSWGRMSKSV